MAEKKNKPTPDSPEVLQARIEALEAELAKSKAEGAEKKETEAQTFGPYKAEMEGEPVLVTFKKDEVFVPDHGVMKAKDLGKSPRHLNRLLENYEEQGGRVNNLVMTVVPAAEGSATKKEASDE